MSKDEEKSYYDWELSFKKETTKKPRNKLGISEEQFREILKEWKKDNLEIEDDTGPNG